jgi:hypothetical protein
LPLPFSLLASQLPRGEQPPLPLFLPWCAELPQAQNDRVQQLWTETSETVNQNILLLKSLPNINPLLTWVCICLCFYCAPTGIFERVIYFQEKGPFNCSKRNTSEWCDQLYERVSDLAQQNFCWLLNTAPSHLCSHWRIQLYLICFILNSFINVQFTYNELCILKVFYMITFITFISMNPSPKSAPLSSPPPTL